MEKMNPLSFKVLGSMLNFSKCRILLHEVDINDYLMLSRLK